MTHFSIRSQAAGVVGAAMLALALGACGGPSDGADPSDQAAQASAAAAATPSAEASAAPRPPLDAFFDAINGDADAISARQTRLEESIASCMSDQGFEYTPVVAASAPTAASATSDLQWGTKEYAEQYGYGATASASLAPAEVDPIDPNQARIDAMSEGERNAYRSALHGTGNAKEAYHWDTAGCQGAAEHEATMATGMDEDQQAALQDEMTAVDVSIAGDPRVSDANVKWAACMAAAGYANLAVVGDAETSFFDQVRQIKQAAYDNVDEATLTDAESAEIDTAIKDQLAALAPTEIKTAVADFTCRDGVGYTQTHLDVAIEYQQAFMDAHQAELDAWMESYLSAK